MIFVGEDFRWSAGISQQRDRDILGSVAQLNTWAFVAASYNFDTGEVVFVVNDEVFSSAIDTDRLRDADLRSTFFSLGHDDDFDGVAFQGSVDRVAAISLALSVSEMRLLRDNVAQYRLPPSPGHAGYALTFDRHGGSGGFVEIGSRRHANLIHDAPLRALTVLAWIKPVTPSRENEHHESISSIVEMGGAGSKMYSLLLTYHPGLDSYRLTVRLGNFEGTSNIKERTGLRNGGSRFDRFGLDNREPGHGTAPAFHDLTVRSYCMGIL